MFVKPAAGLVIRDPHMRDTIPTEGREVVESDYWQRAVRDGDVTVGQPIQPTHDEGSAAQ